MTAPGATARAWLALDRAALRSNVRALQTLLPPGCSLMPVLKANAYGHGAAPVGAELERMGIRGFCVACAEEAIQLRRAGLRGELLILGWTDPACAQALQDYDLIQTVADAAHAEALDACGLPLRVHIKLDTGMHRLGERCEEIGRIAQIFRCRNLRVEGIFTHLCADDRTDARSDAFTRAQAQAFRQTVAELRARGYDCGQEHLLASSGLLNYPELGGRLARVGIALYGVLSERGQLASCPVRLRPVLSAHARVASVRRLWPGEAVGYGPEDASPGARTVAALTIGYADGLPRALSNGRGRVLLNGRSAPILGRICMDQTIVDVTDIPDVRPGQEAVLLGRSGREEITAYDIAEAAGTITNEILSGFGARMARIIL